MINRVPQMLDNEIPRRIAETAEQIRAMKTKQFIGGDNMVVTSTNVASAVFSLPPGQRVYFNARVTPADGRLYNWEFRYTVYVDGGAMSGLNAIPGGASITQPILNLIDISFLPDWGTSADLLGIRTNYIGVKNNDSVSHTIGVQTIWYAVKTATI